MNKEEKMLKQYLEYMQKQNRSVNVVYINDDGTCTITGVTTNNNDYASLLYTHILYYFERFKDEGKELNFLNGLQNIINFLGGKIENESAGSITKNPS